MEAQESGKEGPGEKVVVSTLFGDAKAGGLGIPGVLSYPRISSRTSDRGRRGPEEFERSDGGLGGRSTTYSVLEGGLKD